MFCKPLFLHQHLTNVDRKILTLLSSALLGTDFSAPIFMSCQHGKHRHWKLFSKLKSYDSERCSASRAFYGIKDYCENDSVTHTDRAELRCTAADRQLTTTEPVVTSTARGPSSLLGVPKEHCVPSDPQPEHSPVRLLPSMGLSHHFVSSQRSRKSQSSQTNAGQFGRSRCISKVLGNLRDTACNWG